MIKFLHLFNPLLHMHLIDPILHLIEPDLLLGVINLEFIGILLISRIKRTLEKTVIEY